MLSPKNITVPDKYFTVNITGGGAGGDFDVRVLPLKDSYKDTDQGIKVQITTDPDKFEIGSAIKQVYVNIYSDSNYSNSLITDTVDTSKIYRPGMTTVNQWPIQISSNKGLGNGSHTIYVDLWQAGTQSRIGQGKVVIQVSGSGGGLKNNGIACNDSSECKSNYCDYDTGKCQSCADYEEGVCEAGFTCNSSGVCVTSSSAGGKQPGETAPPVVAFDCTRAGADKDPNYSKYCLENPLPVDSLTDMILLIMRGFLAIVGIWAVVFIIIGGFKMVMAQGNEEAFTSAKKTVTWAIIGLGIALLAFSVIAIVQNFFNISFPANPTSWLRGYKWFI
ncbi:MAG: pilin [Patescibacteria group bacterium]|nr:pilin [Patescibacteria group bacterium]